MNTSDIKRKYDEFFGTGFWESEYKSHIVVFAEGCVREAKNKANQDSHLHNVVPSLFKERRQKLNLSMQDVTDQTDISKSTISRIERGKDAFFETIMKLDKFYTDNGA